tara:strand:- start:209 stop:454 length:246 start_codon:yes stop_codon:yes gene_type:complete
MKNILTSVFGSTTGNLQSVVDKALGSFTTSLRQLKEVNGQIANRQDVLETKKEQIATEQGVLVAMEKYNKTVISNIEKIIG